MSIALRGALPHSIASATVGPAGTLMGTAYKM
jgi:hypothetical protein